MSQESKAKKIFVAALVWCVILGVVAGAYRFVIQPFFADRLETDTGSDSQYKHNVNVAVDSFSGYSILRSPVLRDELKRQGIRLRFDDDGADYVGRMKALRDGKADMAVFTIDSFLTAGAKLGEFPATIFLILDETKGADAIVAYEEGVSTIQDLDDPKARFVLTPNSPSEFLARVVLAEFSLPSLPKKWIDEADGAEAVYKSFRRAKKSEKKAYVLWEPYVTRALAEKGAHTLLDSSQLEGFIIDVLVANRKFLVDNSDVVATIAESYLRSAYSYRNREGGMVELVMTDAKDFGGEKLPKPQAESLVKGIRWKNTLENYAHFGLASREASSGLEILEDMVSKITRVLVTTGALANDPLNGNPNKIYFDAILRDLQSRDFHPSQKLSILEGVDSPDLDSVKAAIQLKALSEAQWNSLVSVGSLRIKPIAFGRGGARLNVQSQRELNELANRLKSLPLYYLMVKGHARAQGDREANLALARQRAQAAMDHLLAAGLHANRVTIRQAAPEATGGTAQSVSFLVGRPPY